MINTHDGRAYIGALDGIECSVRPEVTNDDALRARAAYMELPDLRLDKVLEVQRRIAAGLFQPTAEDLADAILSSASNALLCR